MRYCTEEQFRDVIQRFYATDACWYGDNYNIQFWSGKLICWDKLGFYKLKEWHVGCRGDAVNKLRTFLGMIDQMEHEAAVSSGGVG